MDKYQQYFNLHKELSYLSNFANKVKCLKLNFNNYKRLITELQANEETKPGLVYACEHYHVQFENLLWIILTNIDSIIDALAENSLVFERSSTNGVRDLRLSTKFYALNDRHDLIKSETLGKDDFSIGLKKIAKILRNLTVHEILVKVNFAIATFDNFGQVMAKNTFITCDYFTLQEKLLQRQNGRDRPLNFDINEFIWRYYVDDHIYALIELKNGKSFMPSRESYIWQEMVERSVLSCDFDLQERIRKISDISTFKPSIALEDETMRSVTEEKMMSESSKIAIELLNNKAYCLYRYSKYPEGRERLFQFKFNIGQLIDDIYHLFDNYLSMVFQLIKSVEEDKINLLKQLANELWSDKFPNSEKYIHELFSTELPETLFETMGTN